MLLKVISVVLSLVLAQGSLAAETPPQAPTQSIPAIQAILRKANRNGKVVKVELLQPLENQTKITGRPFEISDSGFTISNSKTGVTTRLRYADVRQVRQKGMPRATEVLLGVGIIFGVGLAIFFAVYPKT